jgi:hypothetical protein
MFRLMEKRKAALVLGGIALAVFAASGLGNAPRPDIDSYAVQAQLCRQMRSAVEQVAKRDPSFPKEAALKQAEEACEQGFSYAPQASPVAVPPSPGCKATQNFPPPGPRRAEAPAQPIPYFAARTGELPEDGAGAVAGVELPKGSRCLGYWASDKPVANAEALAGRLANAYRTTGLWPVLWISSEDPDVYAMDIGDPSDADGLDVERILRRTWPDLRGLAPGAGGERPGDLFGGLSAANDRSADGYVVMLVPANRPGDVLSVLGGAIATEVMSEAELTAVARSWEERFGTVVVGIGPGGLELAVGSPPDDVAQARMLATEHNAFAPDDATSDERGLADAILRGDRPDATVRRDFWGFGWPD